MIEVIILAVLVALTIIFFRKFSNVIYIICIIDIFLRILSKIESMLNIAKFSNFVNKYFSSSIESIINMSEIEKKYWCNYSYNRKIMGKYKISLRCFKFKEASVYYKELKNNKVKLKLHEKIMIYTMYSIVSTMIGKIKK